ncbi:MAG: bifunctional tetrahydrofolate synthase/dihydrofolate synthase [Gammaproteobacteria bacterium]|nr:bifunctional tetrahydrofolate synthase/dihydrofolate synthase [Gammaproteobacteria bacterium]
MTRRSLADWLRWQETLSPREIDLGLERVSVIASRLCLEPPANSVFTVAGTNGKGTTVRFLENLLAAGGRSAAVYTSPHLLRYNERVCVGGREVTDAELVLAFETVEGARRQVPLTYFEFGTLAALWLFSRGAYDAWILEVGMGGRLDAVNVVDPTISLITTVDLDHQRWLGDSVNAIGAEKAGIMRQHQIALFGQRTAPRSVLERARELEADFRMLGRDFDYRTGETEWAWSGRGNQVQGLPALKIGDAPQYANASLALAAIEAHDANLLNRARVADGLMRPGPAGRFQLVRRDHVWVLDVAHNPQAAATLLGRLQHMGEYRDTTAVIGMLADKQIAPFIDVLAGTVCRWVTCTVDGTRVASAAALASEIRAGGELPVVESTDPFEALALAARLTPRGQRILVCGSFRLVGPALEWLGLY